MTQMLKVSAASDDSDGFFRSAHKLGELAKTMRFDGLDIVSLVVSNNARHCVKFLKSINISLDRLSFPDQKHPLEEALDSNAIATFETLLKCGARVDAPHTKHGTIIHAAAATRFLDSLLPALRHYKANMNLPGKFGQRPLHVAVANNQVQNVQQILDNGADINAQDDNLQSALHTAILSRSLDPMVEILLAYGASPIIKDAGGFTPIDLAKKCALAGAIKEMENAIDWRTHLAPNPSITRQAKDPHRFFEDSLEIVKTGDRRKINDLLSDGITPWKPQTNWGSSPMLLAIHRHRLDLAAIFINYRLGLSDYDADGGNAAHMLCTTYTDVPTLEPFLTKLQVLLPGCLTHKNHFEMTPLDAASLKFEDPCNELEPVFDKLCPGATIRAKPKPPPKPEGEANPSA